ncbi:MAG: alpha/beta hydrolase [Bacteroidota bacterium]
MRPSFSSRLTTSILKWSNFKIQVQKRVNKPIKRSQKAFLPEAILKAYQAQSQEVAGKAVATFASKQQVSQTHVIFLHGGAYVFEAVGGHWDIAKMLVEKAHCRMTLIDYPLAPESTYKDTFAMVAEAYDLLCAQFPDDQFVLMGDSAGAGLALAFNQILVKQNHTRLPVKTVLISPWLDLTMLNPEIDKFVKTDHLLTVDMLQSAGSLYAGGDDQTQNLLSPINGEFENLPPTLVLYSNTELFFPDCVKLKVIATAVNANFQFKEYHKMLHDWLVFPMPERQEAIDDICAFLG